MGLSGDVLFVNAQYSYPVRILILFYFLTMSVVNDCVPLHV